MAKEPLLVVELPQYIRQVKLSNSRMAKYYEYGKKHKLPKKYQDTKLFGYKEVKMGGKVRKFLTNLITNERVVANPMSKGTPKWYLINGQDLYNGNMKEHARNKIITAIKENFRPYVKGLPPITKFPVRIQGELHDLMYDPLNKNQLWDVDNRTLGFYIKAFQDLLKAEGIIPDDNVLYITQPPVPLFVPVETTEERKLLFRFYHDQRDCIVNSTHYQIHNHEELP